MRRSPVWLFGMLALVAFGCGGGDEPTAPGGVGADRILWTFGSDAGIYYGSGALSLDEQTAYFGTSNPRFGVFENDHHLYALDIATGAVRWKFPLGSKEVRSTPAVAPDGSLTFVVQERDAAGAVVLRDVVYRLAADGRLQWTFNINPNPRGMDVGLSAPAIAPDGTVYVAGDALYAIDAAGALQWSRLGPAVEDLRNSPVIAPDGTVYFVFHNVPLTAFDPDDGSVIWSRDLGVNDHVVASPAIGPDGTIYVATNPGVLYAVSSGGEIRWTFDVSTIGYQCTFRSSPAIDADGTIYFGTNTGNPASSFLALDPTGIVKWRFDPEDLPPGVPATHFDIYSSPAIGADGSIYFGQEFGRVYALDPALGGVRWMVETRSGIIWPSPAITATGTLLIADLDGRVYAIRTDGGGLKATAWPKFRRDARSSGCAM
ncbi:MAG: PQQ-binding-like beta-propeller repeat protein [bacterium]